VKRTRTSAVSLITAKNLLRIAQESRKVSKRNGEVSDENFQNVRLIESGLKILEKREYLGYPQVD
jgi:hypothetical protein